MLDPSKLRWSPSTLSSYESDIFLSSFWPGQQVKQRVKYWMEVTNVTCRKETRKRRIPFGNRTNRTVVE